MEYKGIHSVGDYTKLVPIARAYGGKIKSIHKEITNTTSDIIVPTSSYGYHMTHISMSVLGTNGYGTVEIVDGSSVRQFLFPILSVLGTLIGQSFFNELVFPFEIPYGYKLIGRSSSSSITLYVSVLGFDEGINS